MKTIIYINFPIMGAVAVPGRAFEHPPARTPLSSGAFVGGSVVVHLIAAALLPGYIAATRAVQHTPTIEFTIAEPEPVVEPVQQPVAPAAPIEPIAAPTPPPAVKRARPVARKAAPPPAPAPVAAVAVGQGEDSSVEVAAVEPPAAPVLAAPVPKVAPVPAPIAAPAAPQPDVDVRALTRGYLKDLTRTLHARKHYPPAALRERLQGTVLVSITIDDKGHIRDVVVKRSSGHAVLDRSALLAVRSSKRLPLPPSEVRWTTRAVTLPIAYVLR